MTKCSFCGYDIARGTGKIFVKKDGKRLDFCSSKCEINMVTHKKKARNLKWTKYYEKKTNVKKQ